MHTRDTRFEFRNHIGNDWAETTDLLLYRDKATDTYTLLFIKGLCFFVKMRFSQFFSSLLCSGPCYKLCERRLLR